MSVLKRAKCSIPECNCIVDMYRVKDDEWKCFELCQKHRKLTRKEHVIDKHILKEVNEVNEEGKLLCAVIECHRVARPYQRKTLVMEQVQNLTEQEKDLLKKLGVKQHNRGNLCEFHARSYDQYSERLVKKNDTTKLRLYNLTKEVYADMWSKQNGKCKICNKNLIINENKVACIDHNHATGKVTALLCSTCNSGIGMLKHNKDTIKAALNFIEANYN